MENECLCLILFSFIFKISHLMTTASCFATGIEERVWGLLPAKAQKRVQSLAAGHEGLPLLSAMACDEDAMSKEDIIAEDGG